MRFAHRLAVQVGEWDVDGMLADMGEAQFRRWMAYYELEPWGEERADLRMARQVWATFQIHSQKQLDENKYRFDFEPKRLLTPREHKAKAMRLFLAQGGQISG